MTASDDLNWLSLKDMQSMLRRREVSPVDLVGSSLAQLARVNDKINAFVTVTADSALDQARAAEDAFKGDTENLPPLTGVPYGVKDLTETAGVRTTFGCVAYKDYVPETSDIPWERLQEAGAILIGKTTTPEFGLLGITQSRLTGVTGTPWAPDYTAGGSSGGSAAAIAAGIFPAAWGSDGGGSIRVPAASCGVVGFKPSTGRIAMRDNGEPSATDGPLGRRVSDVAIQLDVTVGPHQEDRLTLPATGENYAAAAEEIDFLRGKKIGFVNTFDGAAIDPDTRAVFETALEQLESDAGAIPLETSFDIPGSEEFFALYWGPEYVRYVNYAFPDGEDVWPVVAELAERAAALDAGTVSEAMRDGKTAIYNGFAKAFQSYDFIVCPTTPIPPYLHSQAVQSREELRRKSGVIDPTSPDFCHDTFFHRNTEPPSHAGLPCISVPCGFTPQGLPVGLQIIGNRFADAAVISAAASYEHVAPWWKQRPAL